MTTIAPKRRLRRWQDQSWMVLVAIVVAIAIQFAADRVAPPVIGWTVSSFIAAIGLWTCLKGPRVDELALAGLKFAWLWGGFAAMVLGIGLATWAILAGPLPAWPSTPAGLASFSFGIILVLAAQMLAYLAILGIWRWRKGGL